MRTNSLIGCALLALAAACASSNPFRENRVALAAANQQVLDGQAAAARTALEALLVRTKEDSGRFVLQRYFAAYLLSRNSLEASLRARGDDWLAPLVGASYYLNYAQEWSKSAAASSPTGDEGEAMLPEPLAAYGFEKAQAYLDLVWLILCARTGFQDEVAEVIGQEPRLASVAKAEELSQALGVTDALRPWLMWSLFDFQTSRNEQAAYQFGIRARELGRKAPDAFPASQSQQIVRWILEESKLVFKSSAGVEFDPGAEVCSQTGEPNIQFQGTPKR